MDNVLTLKTVNELINIEEKFFIPDYQRGYRWTQDQVTQLLEDIDRFEPEGSGKEKSFYCLQPIVVKLTNGMWEVIDGQQRLTTLSLLVHYFNRWNTEDPYPLPVIEYETRENSYAFLKSLKIDNSVARFKEFMDVKLDCGDWDCEDNIDFYHIATAFKAIHFWIKGKQSSPSSFDRNGFQSKLLQYTKVIWYEVQESENNNVIDIFTRLNIGKIQLTNAELIKALFLQKSNFDENNVLMRQIQIATEWDSIERKLQDDNFWYFIYNTSFPFQYENRIEYIFDLISKKRERSEFYHSFKHFATMFDDATDEDGVKDIDSIWLEIKKYMLTFEEWYNDNDLYHFIGYLIECDGRIDTISKIKTQSEVLDKIDFKDNFLKSEIRNQLRGVNLDETEYSPSEKTRLRKVLLLFNIMTVVNSGKYDMRFPFQNYKKGKWDIEHVNSQTERKIKGANNYKLWLSDTLDFLKPNDELYSLVENMLSDLNKGKKVDDDEFAKLYERIEVEFRGAEAIFDDNNINNLALLDSKTNRSYKNSFFPIKRKQIIDNDQNGIFVPIATKNLFLKYYSKEPGTNFYWTRKNANDYLEEMKNTLKEFLSNN